MPARRDTVPESGPYEQVLLVTSGQIVVGLTGTTEVLKADVGDVIFLPANVEHSYMNVGATSATAVVGRARVG